MERKTYLNRYRLFVDRVGLPIVIRRSADEATLRADDLESGAQVALQVVPAPALGVADREQLEAEARAAQQIDHINIPRLRDFGFDDGQLVYVTDYLEGTTAEDWIKSKGPMPVGAVLRIASQMISALVAGSLHGVIHYAVYPGNIMLVEGETAEGEWPLIKVLNFLGVAPSLSHSSGHGHDSLNPADFASPEQLREGPLTFRSEIYALGGTLWFLLKGVQLSGGATALQYAIGLPGPVRELLEAMLAENPADRPSDPVALQRQIQACLSQIERQDATSSKWGLPVALASVPENESVPLRAPRSARKSLALAAILLGIAMLTALILAQRAHQTVGLTSAAAKSGAPAFKSDVNPRPAEAFDTAGEFSARAENKIAKQNADNIFAGAHSVGRLESQNPAAPKSGLESNAPNSASVERTAPPFMASSLISPDRGIPAIDPGFEASPTPSEAPAPAEGPEANEKPIVETAPPPSAAIEEKAQEEEKTLPIESPKKTAEKVAKSRPTTKSPSKKTAAASKPAHVQPLLRDLPRQYPPPLVGHIFPRPWPTLDLSSAMAEASPPAERPKPHHTPRPPAKKKAPSPPPRPPA